MLFRPRRKRSGSNKAKIGRQTLKKQNLALESEIYCIQIVNIIAPTINTETKVARMKILALTSYKSSKNTSHAVRACSRAGRGRSRMLLVYLRILVGWSYFGFSLLKSATTCCIHSLKIHVFFVEIQTNASSRKTHQEHQFLCNFSWSLTRNNQNREGARKRMVTEPGRALSVENLLEQRNFGSKQSWKARKLAYEGQMHNEISRGGLER